MECKCFFMENHNNNPGKKPDIFMCFMDTKGLKELPHFQNISRKTGDQYSWVP